MILRKSRSRGVVLFAGPSAYGVDPALIASGVTERRPPIRRGDIDRLVATRKAPQVVVIADGVFGSGPAVSHAEICRALDRGWTIWGVSSLGAIRAHELRFDGMHGFGYVHACFERFDDFADDEMCVLHYPEPPYFPVTEALVNVRYILERYGDSLGVTEAQAASVIASLRERWFGDRSIECIKAVFMRAEIRPDAVDRFFEAMSTRRIKSIDLVGLLDWHPW